MVSPSVLPLLAFAVACATPKVTGKSESKEHELLEDSVRIHWQGVRWNDADRASAFIEDPEERLTYRRWFEDEWERHRVTDHTVMSLEMSEEASEPVDGRLRTATAVVRVEGYELPAQILEHEEITQQWYRTRLGWWLDWEPGGAE